MTAPLTKPRPTRTRRKTCGGNRSLLGAAAAWKQAIRASIRSAALAVLLAAAAGAAEGAPKVIALRVPEGGIQPQVVVDRSGEAHLIYFRGDARHGDLFYVRLPAESRDFSRPLQVNRHPASAIAVGNVRGAHLALGRQGRLHVAWMGSEKATPKAPGDATPMLYTSLSDDGAQFEPERNVIQSRVGLDGGGSVAADELGNVYVVWHAPDAGQTGEANRRVWVARSTDDGRTFAAEEAASTGGGCCACCGLRALVDRNGRLHILYRSAAETVHRDMYWLASQKPGADFTANKIDEWQVPACVMSTAALSQGSSGVLAAWETKGQTFFTLSNATPGKLTRAIAAPGDGRDRKHPAIAANQRGDVILVWTEGMGWNRGGAVAWQVFDPQGREIAGAKGRLPGVPTWSLPAVFAQADGDFTVIF